MKYYPDKSGRFKECVYYTSEEIDNKFEELIISYLSEVHKPLIFPIDTEDLTKLIERSAEFLDLYADLSDDGDDAEGLTEIVLDGKPRVYIKKELYEDPKNSKRLRTTLAHEYGHSILHGKLKPLIGNTPEIHFLPRNTNSSVLSCGEANIHKKVAETNWLEWQAWYACGSILMPITPLKDIVEPFMDRYNVKKGINVDARSVEQLILRLAREFDVSKSAVKIRLIKLGYFAQ